MPIHQINSQSGPIVLISGNKQTGEFFGLSNDAIGQYTFNDGQGVNYAGINSAEVFLQAQKIVNSTVRGHFVSDVRKKNHEQNQAEYARAVFSNPFFSQIPSGGNNVDVKHLLEVQNYINYIKYMQDPNFKSAIDTFINGVRRSSQENSPVFLHWIIGENGDVNNQLGNSQVAFAYALMDTNFSSALFNDGKLRTNLTLQDFLTSSNGLMVAEMASRNRTTQQQYETYVRSALMQSMQPQPQQTVMPPQNFGGGAPQPQYMQPQPNVPQARSIKHNFSQLPITREWCYTNDQHGKQRLIVNPTNLQVVRLEYLDGTPPIWTPARSYNKEDQKMKNISTEFEAWRLLQQPQNSAATDAGSAARAGFFSGAANANVQSNNNFITELNKLIKEISDYKDEKVKESTKPGASTKQKDEVVVKYNGAMALLGVLSLLLKTPQDGAAIQRAKLHCDAALAKQNNPIFAATFHSTLEDYYKRARGILEKLSPSPSSSSHPQQR